GLEANDPSVMQYQLWIFDAERSADHPVDGGVFDIPAGGGEVIVPIDPKLAVSDATLFAITVEQPGGVVVSARERIVLLAQPAQG
ncbi:MAG: anti-sigma factor, partial [Planctomycetota bacterium]